MYFNNFSLDENDESSLKSQNGKVVYTTSSFFNMVLKDIQTRG